MSPHIPAYYTSLAPFRSLFNEGLPILTYHKLGPRPRGVRLKGLYVSMTLFERQLAELRQAGFATVLLDRAVQRSVKHAQEFALTFDDGFSNVLRYGLEPLTKHGFRAVQFLVSDLIGKTNEWEQREGEVHETVMDDAQIRDWLAAGHQIGSHTRTHPRLTQISPAAAREEIGASKKKLEDRFGIAVQHFCYPYGDWNDRVRDLVIAAGYKTACTTDPGINAASDSPFALKRLTARYRSRSLKAFWSRLSRNSELD
jgi:peptidoglycan/xylan/chitin deacetylase (PgdA/CDA1 family)